MPFENFGELMSWTDNQSTFFIGPSRIPRPISVMNDEVDFDNPETISTLKKNEFPISPIAGTSFPSSEAMEKAKNVVENSPVQSSLVSSKKTAIQTLEMFRILESLKTFISSVPKDSFVRVVYNNSSEPLPNNIFLYLVGIKKGHCEFVDSYFEEAKNDFLPSQHCIFIASNIQFEKKYSSYVSSFVLDINEEKIEDGDILEVTKGDKTYNVFGFVENSKSHRWSLLKQLRHDFLTYQDILSVCDSDVNYEKIRVRCVEAYSIFNNVTSFQFYKNGFCNDSYEIKSIEEDFDVYRKVHFDPMTKKDNLYSKILEESKILDLSDMDYFVYLEFFVDKIIFYQGTKALLKFLPLNDSAKDQLQSFVEHFYHGKVKKPRTNSVTLFCYVPKSNSEDPILDQIVVIDVVCSQYSYKTGFEWRVCLDRLLTTSSELVFNLPFSLIYHPWKSFHSSKDEFSKMNLFKRDNSGVIYLFRSHAIHDTQINLCSYFRATNGNFLPDSYSDKNRRKIYEDKDGKKILFDKKQSFLYDVKFDSIKRERGPHEKIFLIKRFFPNLEVPFLRLGRYDHIPNDTLVFQKNSFTGNDLLDRYYHVKKDVYSEYRKDFSVVPILDPIKDSIKIDEIRDFLKNAKFVSGLDKGFITYLNQILQDTCYNSNNHAGRVCTIVKENYNKLDFFLTSGGKRKANSDKPTPLSLAGFKNQFVKDSKTVIRINDTQLIDVDKFFGDFGFYNMPLARTKLASHFRSEKDFFLFHYDAEKNSNFFGFEHGRTYIMKLSPSLHNTFRLMHTNVSMANIEVCLNYMSLKKKQEIDNRKAQIKEKDINNSRKKLDYQIDRNKGRTFSKVVERATELLDNNGNLKPLPDVKSSAWNEGWRK